MRRAGEEARGEGVDAGEEGWRNGAVGKVEEARVCEGGEKGVRGREGGGGRGEERGEGDELGAF